MRSVSVLEGLGVGTMMRVALGETWMTYVVLWHIHKDFRRQGRKLPHDRKRTVAASMTVVAILSAVGASLGIVQPWGARTFLFFFGSLGVAVIIGGLLGAAGAASHDIRRAADGQT